MGARAARIFAGILVVSALAVSACTPKAGDTCKPGADRCVDNAHALACVSGAYVAVACRGADGCASKGGAPRCDDTLAQPGDVCAREDNHACSVDHASMLVCHAGTMRVALRCRGTSGCATLPDRIACDDSIADLGDACDAEGDLACAHDRKSMLTCRSHTFVAARGCSSPCEVRGREIACP